MVVLTILMKNAVIFLSRTVKPINLENLGAIKCRIILGMSIILAYFGSLNIVFIANQIEVIKLT